MASQLVRWRLSRRQGAGAGELRSEAVEEGGGRVGQGGGVIIDAWMQHPTAEFLREPMFDSLRRWARGRLADGRDPGRGDRGGDGRGGRQHRDALRVVGPARAADLERRGRGDGRRRTRTASSAWPRSTCARPMDAVRELRRLRARARLPGAAGGAVAVEPAARRPPLLPALRRVRRARHPVLPAGRAHRAAVPVGARAADPLPRQGRARVPRADDRRRPHRLPVDGGDDRAGDQVPERLHRHLGLQGAAATRASWSTTCAGTAGRRCCSAPTTRPGPRPTAWPTWPASGSTPRRPSCSCTATRNTCSAWAWARRGSPDKPGSNDPACRLAARSA